MTDNISAPRATKLLQTTLAKPWFFRRNGRYYLRIRPKSTTTQYFTVSLRTSDRSTAMDISKDILKALGVFHLTNPNATWEALRPQLLTIADECLTMAHGDSSLVAYEVVYDELKETLSQASAKNAFTLDQQRALAMGHRILSAAQERLQGRPEGLIGLVQELSEGPSVSLSVRGPESHPHATPQAHHHAAQRPPISWKELADAYLAERGEAIAETSINQIESNHKILAEAFESVGVEDMRKHTRADLIAVRAELFETRKASTVNTILSKLITVCNWAVANDHLDKAFTKKLKLTKGTESDREAFTRPQVESIMSYANGLPKLSWQRWALSLLVVSGARVGEILQLTREDILKKDGEWCVSINEDGDDKNIKNKYSRRFVPLTDGALGFDLTAFLEAVDAGHLASVTGKTVARNSGVIRKMINGLLGDSKTDNQTTHSLRHHMAGSLQARGIPLAYAQAILGHASNSMSYDTYGSGVPVEALAGALRSVWLPVVITA